MQSEGSIGELIYGVGEALLKAGVEGLKGKVKGTVKGTVKRNSTKWTINS